MTTLFHLTANNANGVLDAALDLTSMTFDLDTGEGDNFPETDATSAPFWVTINDEIIEIEDRSDDTFTIETRGDQNTLASAHSLGDSVELFDTSGLMEELQDAVNDAEDDIADIIDGSTTLASVTTSGDIICGDSIGDGALDIRGAAENIRGLKISTGDSARMAFAINDTSESGANAGSDCAIITFDDDGAPLGFPFIITRATGDITMTNDLAVNGTLTIGHTDSMPLNIYKDTSTQWDHVSMDGQLLNSVDEITSYSRIRTQIETNTDGSEDGRMLLSVIVAGTQTNIADIRNTELHVYKNLVVDGGLVEISNSDTIGLSVTGDSWTGISIESTGTDTDPTVTLQSKTGDPWTIRNDESVDNEFVIRHGGNTRLQIDTDGNLIVKAELVTDNIHNNGGTDNTGAVASGTYSPTLTIVTNLSATANGTGFWTRVGDVVHVSMKCTADASATGLCTFRCSLPAASTLSSTGDLIGVGALNNSGPTVSIEPDTTNDEAEFNFTAVLTSNQWVWATFSYVVA